MAYSFYGTGTSFYGHDDEGPDGSYITTEWTVFLYVPVRPIASFRVRPVGDHKNIALPPALVQEFPKVEVPLHKKQVRKTQLAVLKVIVGVIFVFIVLSLIGEKCR